MKKILFLLFIGLNALLCGTKAATNQNYVSETNQNHVVIVLDLGDEDVNDKLNSRLEEVFELVNVKLDSIEEIQCSITIKVKITAGVISGEASVTVSGPCDEVEAEVERVTKQCVEKAERALQDAL